jgi:hypothetical protein
MTELNTIIANGIARYQALYAPPLADVAELEPTPIITLDEETQIQICLRCELADCVDVTDSRCPIRAAQRAMWRSRRQA